MTRNNRQRSSVSEGDTNISRRDFISHSLIIIVLAITSLFYGRAWGISEVIERVEKMEDICMGDDE